MARQKFGWLFAGLVMIGAAGFAPLVRAQDQAVPPAAPLAAITPATPVEASDDPALAGIPGDPAALGGYDVLIADRGNNRILLVSPEKKTLWEYDFQGLKPGHGADDAFFTDGGKSVITNLEEEHVIQVIDRASNTVIWSYGTMGKAGTADGLLHNPDDAYKLPNGDIVVADIRNCRILEIAPDKHIVRQAGKTGQCWGGGDMLASPNGDKPLPNGHLLVSTITDQSLIELDENWKPVNRLTLPIKYPSDPQMTAAGNYLVAGYTNPGTLIEISHSGQIVWQYQGTGECALNQPSLAMELPNGNVMVTDDLNARVVVIDKASNRIVWQYGVKGHPGAAPGYLHIPDGLDIIKAE